MESAKLSRHLLFLLPPLLGLGGIVAKNVAAVEAVTPGPAAHWERLADADPKDPKAIEFFQTKIQPLLKASCLGCHGAQRPRAGLRLDSRESILKGGASGPAAVPGDPDKSLIIKAVKWDDPDLKMPPRHKLSDDQIADLKHWVELGLPYADAAQ